MKTRQQAEEIMDLLALEYPGAECTLDTSSAWQLLVSVRLAAQCTDARVNEIMPVLLEKFPDVNSLADAPVEEIIEIVKPCGLGNSKGRDIKRCMTMLRDEFGGEVPDTMEDLLKLPGVGRKSANLVLGDIFGKPAIVTDTHCIRLSNRIGLLKTATTEPAKVEKQLWEVLNPEKRNDFCHRLVLHGRAVCTRRKPYCEKCCLADVCDFAKNNKE